MQWRERPQGKSLNRPLRVRTGGAIICFIWVAAYFAVSLAALLSTYLFPALLSPFRSHSLYSEPYLLHKQGELGLLSNFNRLSWTQEQLPPHFSRWVKQDMNVEQSALHYKLWRNPPNRGFVPCLEPSPSYKASKGSSRGFLVVQSNGGLNQMRAGICDMVAVAHILNATLVIPELDKRSFWHDSSNFSDIFDEEYFIKALQHDVEVVKKLPRELATVPKAHKQFRSWSNVNYYEEEIAPLWQDYKVIRAGKSDSRLANNGLPADIQKLRCRVHYDALRFAPRIEAFGRKLVERMRSNGPYISLHLRYEKDMLAFSGCTYGLTDEEADDLTSIRENTVHWKIKIINSTEQRVKGLCPLTPKEVGIFLHSLGYPSSTRIYIAAGEIYGGSQRIAELQTYFPSIMRKETIASAEELVPFSNHSSQMAALDYIVSVESDVFVPSYSGNMARAVEGHRRFLGHRKTIIPDRKELVMLFDKLDAGEIQVGPKFSREVMEIHKRRQGAPRKRKGPPTGTKGKDRYRTEEAFYTNPLPDCLCQSPLTSSLVETTLKNRGHV
ncbi:hypothetical protein O6H91_Y039300 [Diphasiastrum complanatum]|nr:hypothetical protein O6H91_Y039300 [Diphasiastrum complanatum]KAJ7297732.1 hypothetical protein O6H91_Y039300 [Diphasiastrum complanatum]KAJ7297733.1 hypothetical protein O6H91_Y039300 [Diphasiastrum complanatum]KAJ7297734.1 hypothetical protein O6H91_Y039300 [Diphasiastrum complanatum]KAJ7297735.1 hypothetical protein O6H91_Y039300 [Diphasiastrum complanatum]